MRFIGASNYDHGTKPKIGVLLTNLGTPEAPTAKALRPYLKQFLWDPRVVEVCLLYTSPSPRDVEESRMPSSA